MKLYWFPHQQYYPTIDIPLYTEASALLMTPEDQEDLREFDGAAALSLDGRRCVIHATHPFSVPQKQPGKAKGSRVWKPL